MTESGSFVEELSEFAERGEVDTIGVVGLGSTEVIFGEIEVGDGEILHEGVEEDIEAAHAELREEGDSLVVVFVSFSPLFKSS